MFKFGSVCVCSNLGSVCVCSNLVGVCVCSNLGEVDSRLSDPCWITCVHPLYTVQKYTNTNDIQTSGNT